MNIFQKIGKKIKETFIPKSIDQEKGKKEKRVSKPIQEKKPQHKKSVKKEGFFSRLKKLNLFKKTEPKKPIPKREVKKQTYYKPSRNYGNYKGSYSIYNKAKKPQYDLISDMSVRVRLETSKGVTFRHWAIFSKNKKVSNKEVLAQIENDIYVDGNIHTIFSTSGQSFEIYSFSIVSSYRN